MFNDHGMPLLAAIVYGPMGLVFMSAGIVAFMSFISVDNGLIAALFALPFIIVGFMMICASVFSLMKVLKEKGYIKPKNGDNDRSDDRHEFFMTLIKSNSSSMFVGSFWMFLGVIMAIAASYDWSWITGIISVACALFAAAGFYMVVRAVRKIKKGMESYDGKANFACAAVGDDEADERTSFDDDTHEERPNVITFFNCPYCGALNGMGNKVCHSCRKKLQ